MSLLISVHGVGIMCKHIGQCFDMAVNSISKWLAFQRLENAQYVQCSVFYFHLDIVFQWQKQQGACVLFKHELNIAQ